MTVTFTGATAMSAMPDRLLTLQEAADYLQICTKRLAQLTSKGIVPAIKSLGNGGRAVRYSRAGLNRWVAQQEEASLKSA